jgi:hypothetical protein
MKWKKKLVYVLVAMKPLGICNSRIHGCICVMNVVWKYLNYSKESKEGNKCYLHLNAHVVKKPVVHTNVLPTMAGDVKLHYCSDCYQKKTKEETEREERNKTAFEQETKERVKQRRYEYLKREIELRELEEKAKEFGID